MLPLASRRPWSCLQCLKLARRFQQSLATASAEVPRTPQTRHALLADFTLPDVYHDDQTLRRIFDSRPAWEDFSRQARGKPQVQSTGLFRNIYLVSPEGFDVFARQSLGKCVRVVTKIRDISTTVGYIGIVRDLDRLSDLLCRVIDLCDFVRAMHPDVRFQKAAASAYSMMFEYMNELNTTTELYDQLKKAMAVPAIVRSWSEEERMTAQILMKDFNKSAIRLPLKGKQRFIELSSQISQLGSEFVNNTRPAQPYVTIASGSQKGSHLPFARPVMGGRLQVPTAGSESTMALQTLEDETARRGIYLASRTSGKEQIERLETLLKRRAEIAKLSGFVSYGHMTLAEKMAKSPESVDGFLQALFQTNKIRVLTEYDELSRLKAANNPASIVNAWDREYYTYKLKSQARPKTSRSQSLARYFSLGTVMQGLSRLCTRLYGIRLVPRQTLPGETWNDDVRRLDVVDEDEGQIAVLYCDLFERVGKNPNPAHFTIRCSRKITEEEIAQTEYDDYHVAERDDAVTDGMASIRHGRRELLQLPTIAFTCDFSRPSGDHPTLLSFREMQTLFHEMGHALHSIIGRTTMQNVSGTRCATDFAELPSVLMENFAADKDALALFARDWESDAELPYEMVEEIVRLNRQFEGADIESQLILAMLDQRYHSSTALDSGFDSTKIYHELMDQHATFREPRETSWQGLFGHLFGYGATYYSYLFDRAISGKVWRDVFQKAEYGPVSREAGARFRDEVLKWGGGRDGWRCVAGVLADESLAEGGEAAMTKVGQWGVHD